MHACRNGSRDRTSDDCMYAESCAAQHIHPIHEFLQREVALCLMKACMQRVVASCGLASNDCVQQDESRDLMIHLH